MLLFLKHLKHIAYLLSYDLAAGILAEVVLPIFRQYKQLSEGSPPSKLPRLQVPGKQLDNYHVLHECLCIFVMYLSDIRLVKAFYNEENIGYMQDLLSVPELQRGVCDLIKVGIDNIAFLGDNSHEQVALSRRLIQLQMNSSNRASQLFQALLHSCAKQSQTKFWLDEAPNMALLAGHKPVDILYITALQWTLNFELLKTSQLFYNEFAKIYSIPVEMTVDEDDEGEEEVQQQQRLRHGDKTIIDILKLNYNALSCFLMLPKAAATPTTTITTTTATSTPTTATAMATATTLLRGSSSLESLVSHVPLSALAASMTTSRASSDYADSSLDYATIIDTYAEQAQPLPSFLHHLQESTGPDESIVLFDIRGSQQQESLHAQSSVVEGDDGLIGKLFNMVGSLLFGVGATPSTNTTPSTETPPPPIDADLLCLYEANGECKKLLLKLFEATMAICIKGFQNEEGE